MAYRIRYLAVRNIRSRVVLRVRLPALTALCFLLFLVLVQFTWPEGAECIRGGLDQLASGLQNEESLMAVLADFLTVFSA